MERYEAAVAHFEREQDNLLCLPCGMAKLGGNFYVESHQNAHYYWVNDFGHSAEDRIEWELSVLKDVLCRGWLLIRTESVQKLILEVNDTSLTIQTSGIGWERLVIENIPLVQGSNAIILRPGEANLDASIKALELLPVDQCLAYEQRVKEFRSDVSWFAESGYGLFLQYGVWGAPRHGEKPSAEEMTNKFDVDQFIAFVKKTGAKYLLWSLTWCEFRMQMPNKLVESVLGEGFTTKRDLVTEIAKACHNHGIRFMLYYHHGVHEEPKWRKATAYPDTFMDTGCSDRSKFYEYWIGLISEVGEKLGKNLDGWFFDDGSLYYPSPFESLGKAAKAGNPDRIISYNAWVGPSITDFQDTVFGEGLDGALDPKQPTQNGIFIQGKEKGLQNHAMWMMEGDDWGIHLPEQKVHTVVTAEQVKAAIQSAKKRLVPISLNFQMWYPMEIHEETKAILESLAL